MHIYRPKQIKYSKMLHNGCNFSDCNRYFFNPFSLEILRKVMARIRESYYEKPRQMQLYFYYPSDEYMAYLMTVEELTFLDEIDCRDLFSGDNPRERIVIFEL